MKEKILIFGIANDIGLSFSKYCLDKGYSVFGIDNLSKNDIIKVDPRVTFYKVDITSNKVQDYITKINPSIIYIFINSGTDLSNLVNCIGDIKTVYVSSQDVYPPVEFVKEDVVNFKTKNGKIHKKLEDTIKKLSNWVIIRPLNIISMTHFKSTFLENWFILAQKGSSKVKVSSNITCITPIEYYNKALFDVLDYNNEIINICNPISYTQEQIFDMFNELSVAWGFNKLEKEVVNTPLLSYNISNYTSNNDLEEINLKQYIENWIKNHSY